VLGWQPSEFWKANPVTLSNAIQGYQEANGVTEEKYMTRERFLELKWEDKERQRKNGNT